MRSDPKGQCAAAFRSLEEVNTCGLTYFWVLEMQAFEQVHGTWMSMVGRTCSFLSVVQGNNRKVSGGHRFQFQVDSRIIPGDEVLHH